MTDCPKNRWTVELALVPNSTEIAAHAQTRFHALPEWTVKYLHNHARDFLASSRWISDDRNRMLRGTFDGGRN